MRPNQYYNESQDLFNRNVKGMSIGAIIILFLVVSCPLWFIGFIIERRIYPKLRGMDELLATAGTSVVLFCCLWILKRLLFGNKLRGWWVWILLSAFCWIIAFCFR
jgi:hypothetical protein